jgi:hypothetical protein
MQKHAIKKIAIGYALGLLSIAAIAYAGTGTPTPAVGLYWLLNGDPTTAPGASAPLNQLGIRTDSASIYYKSGAANTAWTRLGTGASSGGVTGTGTANTTTKWISTTAIGNGWALDDGSTWGVPGVFSLSESTGDVSMLGGLQIGHGLSVGTTSEFGGDVIMNSGANDNYILALCALESCTQDIDLYSAGTGAIKINSNSGGIGNGGTGGIQIFPGANSSTAEVSIANHIVSTGAAAALACNGTGPTTCSSAVCDDIAGTIAIDAGATSCTVTFAGTYTTGPSCNVSPGSSTATPPYISTRSATGITITTTGTLPVLIDYMCIGHT